MSSCDPDPFLYPQVLHLQVPHSPCAEPLGDPSYCTRVRSHSHNCFQLHRLPHVAKKIPRAAPFTTSIRLQRCRATSCTVADSNCPASVCTRTAALHRLTAAFACTEPSHVHFNVDFVKHFLVRIVPSHFRHDIDATRKCFQLHLSPLLGVSGVRMSTVHCRSGGSTVR